MRTSPRLAAALVLLAPFVLCFARPAIVRAQELEPRALTNLPVGTNFAVVGYGYSRGDLLLDPAVPIEDLDAKLHSMFGAYVRAIDFFGKSGTFDVVVPAAVGDWTGIVAGRDSSTSRSGFGDPRIRLAVNFLGAPALNKPDFPMYRPRTVAGASLLVVAPLGQYDPSKLINLGSNRWAFRPRVGIARSTGMWTVEAYTSVWIFTPNLDFFGGSRLSQKPLFGFIVHGVRSLPRRMWTALGVGYAIGGRTRIDGVTRETRISTFRFGLTFAVPFGAVHTLKLVLASGARVERGADFDAAALAYQFRW